MAGPRQRGRPQPSAPQAQHHAQPGTGSHRGGVAPTVAAAAGRSAGDHPRVRQCPGFALGAGPLPAPPRREQPARAAGRRQWGVGPGGPAQALQGLRAGLRARGHQVPAADARRDRSALPVRGHRPGHALGVRAHLCGHGNHQRGRLRQPPARGRPDAHRQAAHRQRRVLHRPLPAQVAHPQRQASLRRAVSRAGHRASALSSQAPSDQRPGRALQRPYCRDHRPDPIPQRCRA